ncbi:uncharacterized protein LOC128883253 isoform X2 [Hylaeus volcanicus]|uniref:uncharacterized protein LOC128883253 isoform X2 n=1 Tax=Hylaeus volcanicus TaxID=313075 RepID=UPI0023B83624|nr:uncharacterized protein LOC128883253 isoform X2 [Hylaeus volcanicus]
MLHHHKRRNKTKCHAEAIKKYGSTSYLDFPIFSICRGLFNNSESTHQEIFLVSGGGGGASYGIPNRLECYQFTSKGLELITSHITLGIIDHITFNEPKEFFFGCQKNKCTVFCFDTSTQSIKFLCSWVGVLTHGDQPKEKHKMLSLECCAIHPEGTFISTYGQDRRLCLYSFEYDKASFKTVIKQAACLKNLHTSSVTQISFSSNGLYLLTCSRDGNLCVNQFKKTEPYSITVLYKCHIKTLLSPHLDLATESVSYIHPRSLLWMTQQNNATNSQSPLVFALSSSTNLAVTFLSIIALNVETDESLNAPKVSLCVEFNLKQRQCRMFNRICSNADTSWVAAVSNTLLYLYTLNKHTLKLLLTHPRSLDPSACEFPTTGCIFLQTCQTVVITSGDYSITCFNLPKLRKNNTTYSLIKRILKLTFSLIEIIGLSVFLLLCVNGFLKGYTAHTDLYDLPYIKQGVPVQALCRLSLSQFISRFVSGTLIQLPPSTNSTL